MSHSNCGFGVAAQVFFEASPEMSVLISHVVFLRHGDTARVNQHVVGGRYLVLNSPWGPSSRDTVVQRSGAEVTIESKEVVLKVASGKVVYLETVYPMDGTLEFVELSPNPRPYDFFLSKRHLLARLATRAPAATTDKAVMHLRKRRVSCFLVPMALWLARGAVEYFLAEAPRRVIAHIADASAEAGDAITIKTTLGTLLRPFYTAQKMLLRLGSPVVLVGGLHMVPTTMCLSVFSRMYSALTGSLVEAVHLLNNSSYNPLKKRRDSVILSTDQIFMSVLVFSFLLLIIFNIAHFHVFFVLVALCSEALKMACDFIDFVLVDTSECRTYALTIEGGKHPRLGLGYACVSAWDRIVLAAEASFWSSELSRDGFLAELLFGIK